MAEQDYLTPVFDGYSSDGTVRSTRNLRPAHFLFKIKSYSLLCETGAETIESHIFEAEGYKWNLCLYPKGNHKSEGNDHISLYLKVADTASLPCVWEVNAKLTFFVFDQLHDEYLFIQDGAIRRFHETKNEWGVPQLLPLDFFNDISKGYLVDDCCVFGVEVFVLKHTGRIDGLPVKKHGWKIKKVPTLDKALCSLERFTPRGILRKLHGYSKVDSVSRSNQKVYAECHKREKSQLDIKSHQDYTGTIRSMRDFGPAHFLLKIDSYSSLCKKGAEMYESHSFEAGGHKWNLCVYPKGNRKSQGNDHISLYLKIADHKTSLRPGGEVNAKFTFFVFDQLRDKYLTIEDGAIRRFHEMKTEWGVPRLLSLDIFNDISKGYLVDDCCVFGVEVFVLNHTGRMECMSMVKNPANNIYTLEIDNFSSLNKAFYYSDVFTIQGVRWWLFYYPRGYLKAKEGLSVFLCNVEKQKVYAEFKLRVKNQVDAKRNVEVAVRYWFPGSPLKMIGPDCIISLKDLNDISKGYILENDTLILEAEIMVTSETKNLS